MDIVALAETIFGFVAIVAIGWALRRFGVLAATDARPINNIIIYVGLPALIFRAVYPATLEPELAIVAAVAWGVIIVSGLLSWMACRLLKVPPAIFGGFLLAATLGNTGYIGYPVCLAVLGDEGLVRAIFYDIFGTVAALLLVGLFVAQHFGSAEGRRINPLREVIAFPAVIALAVALLMRVLPIEIPVVVSDGLEHLANLVVPLIMIAVGLSLRMRALGEHAVTLAALAAIRLIAAPIVALALGSAVLGDPDAVRLVVLEASMPSMMLSLVIGTRFKLDTDFIASAILVTTIVSVATIPLMQVIAG